jgi:ubiquinol-cytochrome c reductase cytochrome b subunit
MKRLVLGAWQWIDDRLGLADLIGPAAKHLVPHDARWWYTFGSATMVAFIVQVVTGVALSFSYVSSSSQAYETLKFIPTRHRGEFPPRHALLWRVCHGAMVRRLWRRPSFTPKFPREMNWTTGVLLPPSPSPWDLPGASRWDQTATVSGDRGEQTPARSTVGDWLAPLHPTTRRLGAQH